MTATLESRWTPPRADCRNPEWWHSMDDESTELEVTELVAAFVRALQPELVVECGTAFGQTAEAIGLALQRNGHGQLITFEFNVDRAAFARKRCARMPVRVVTGVFGAFEYEAPIDFAWIDGHINERASDIESIRHQLSDRAIVAVHDSGPQHDQRERLEAIDWIRWINLQTPRGVMFGQPV